MALDKSKLEKQFLSDYGDEGQRRHHPAVSVAAFMAVYFVYLVSSMIPVLIVLFVIGVCLGVVPPSILAVLTTAIALEFAIPLPNASKPDIARKVFFERLCQEGIQHYFPGKSIFLPGDDGLSKDRAYILAAYPHGLNGPRADKKFQ